MKMRPSSPLFRIFFRHPLRPSALPPAPPRHPTRGTASGRAAGAGGRVQPGEKAHKADSTFKKNESPTPTLPHPAALPPERHGGEASEGVAIGAL